MKKISLILTGIIIGILMSFIFSSFSKETVEIEDNEPIEPAFIFGDLSVAAGDNLCVIQSVSNDMPFILIRLTDSGFISVINIFDNHLNNFKFTDLESDGIWDRWVYGNKQESYSYNHMSGFPDSASIPGTNSHLANDLLIRIDGEYIKSKSIDGSVYVEKGGKLIELEEYHPQHFRIKESEPVE